jgi:hypothetical protein
MKIDQEEFERKAQHILDTIVKPQVERYEKARFKELVSDEKTDTYRRIEERRKLGILKQLVEEMRNDPWHVRLRRWWRLERWVWRCRTRWIWDLDYEHNIFRKKR